MPSSLLSRATQMCPAFVSWAFVIDTQPRRAVHRRLLRYETRQTTSENRRHVRRWRLGVSGEFLANLKEPAQAARRARGAGLLLRGAPLHHGIKLSKDFRLVTAPSKRRQVVEELPDGSVRELCTRPIAATSRRPKLAPARLEWRHRTTSRVQDSDSLPNFQIRWASLFEANQCLINELSYIAFV
jgi:hypothetical protein